MLGHVHGNYGEEYIVYGGLEARNEDICRGIGGLFAKYFRSSRAARATDLINVVAIMGLKYTEWRRPSIVQLRLCVSL